MQYPTFSATLAEQHRDSLRRQAEQVRLTRGSGDARWQRWQATYLRWRLVIRTTGS